MPWQKMNRPSILSGRSVMFAALTLLLAACDQGHRPMPPPATIHNPVAAVRATLPARDTLSPIEARLGIPLYPGAHSSLGPDGARVAPTISDGMVSALLESKDSMQAVIDYYRDRLTVSANGRSVPPSEQVSTHDGQQVTSLTQIEGGTGIRLAEIRPGNNGTQIELMHMQAVRSTGATLSKTPGPFLPGR